MPKAVVYRLLHLESEVYFLNRVPMGVSLPAKDLPCLTRLKVGWRGQTWRRKWLEVEMEGFTSLCFIQDGRRKIMLPKKKRNQIFLRA